MRPPGVAASFDECDVLAQAKIVAYDQIRQNEDDKREAKLAGARVI